MALSAVLQSLPFPIAGPVPLWRRLVCWVCLIPFFLALEGKAVDGRSLSIKQSACLGYACGIFWYFGNCYWIYPTMHTYGDLPQPVAAMILLLFAMYLGLYHALFAALWRMLRKRWSPETVLLLAPCLWVSVELARSRITGFPWDLLGYTQVEKSLFIRMVPFTGVMGASLVVAYGNVLFLQAARGKRKFVQLAAAALGVLILFCAFRPDAPSVFKPGEHAVLLQDNLLVGAAAAGQPRESAGELTADLSARSAAEVRTGPTSVILWPEAPSNMVDGDPLFRQQVSSLAAAAHAPVIADSVAIDGSPQREELYNSASFFAADGAYSGRYDKMHLVPFGEYTPFKRIFFFAGHLLDNVGGFVPGTKRTLFVTGGHRYGVFICYESIFGDEIREFVHNGADVLVNLSDDGWYGDSSAPWEHLDMARMRAIENHRWVLRATNTGVTTVIDPRGNVGPTLPRHVRGALRAPFMYENDTTFYTLHGDWIAWLSVIVILSFLAFGFTRRVEVH